MLAGDSLSFSVNLSASHLTMFFKVILLWILLTSQCARGWHMYFLFLSLLETGSVGAHDPVFRDQVWLQIFLETRHLTILATACVVVHLGGLAAERLFMGVLVEVWLGNGAHLVVVLGVVLAVHRLVVCECLHRWLTVQVNAAVVCREVRLDGSSWAGSVMRGISGRLGHNAYLSFVVGCTARLDSLKICLNWLSTIGRLCGVNGRWDIWSHSVTSSLNVAWTKRIKLFLVWALPEQLVLRVELRVWWLIYVHV